MNRDASASTRSRSRAPMTYAIIAGTAGGVGTTTATAMLVDGMRRHLQRMPMLADHSDGRLGQRLPEHQSSALADESLGLHDFGAHARGVALEHLGAPNVVLLLVTPATPVGLSMAVDVVEAARSRYGERVRERILLIPVAVSGRGMSGRATQRFLHARESVRGMRVAAIPRDAALRAGGRIPSDRLSRRTTDAQHRLVTAVTDLTQAVQDLPA